MAKRLSVLKPRRLRNLLYNFFSFSCYNVEETATNFEKDMFRKEALTHEQNKTLNVPFSMIFHLCAKSAVYSGQELTVALYYITKQLRNVEYWKSPKKLGNSKYQSPTRLL